MRASTGFASPSIGLFVLAAVVLPIAACTRADSDDDVSLAATVTTAGAVLESTGASPAPDMAGVEDLLDDPPADMKPVEIVAFSGEGQLLGPGFGRTEFMTGCPSKYTSPLTDRPYWQSLWSPGAGVVNPLPEDAAWLIAAQTGDQPLLDLPRRSRLRGHLGDPQFGHCPNADRIFVVDAIVERIEEKADLDALQGIGDWRWHHDPARNVRVPYPQGWEMTERAAGTYVFNTDRLPHDEVTLAVRRDPNRQVPRDQESGGGPEVGYVRQYPPEDLGLRGMPRLEGRTRYCNGDALGGCVEVVFRENGHEYVLRHEYGIGFDAEPEGMNVFRDMVHGLQIEGRATVTPTPVLSNEIGTGPLWSQDQAVGKALEMIPFGPWDVTDARLVTEQEAWRLNRCDMGRDDPEPLWYTYPSAVWIVEMTGLFEEKHTVYYTYLDAESGWHICTAEQGRPRQVSGESTPEPQAAP